MAVDPRPSSAAAEARQLIGDVQRLGIDTARGVVERFSAMVGAAVVKQGAASTQRDTQPFNDVVAAAFAAAAAVAGTAADAARRWSANEAEAQHGGKVRILVPHGASRGTASFWLHNQTTAPIVDLAVAATGLVGEAGTIERDAVSISPETVASLGPGASQEITVTVTAEALPEGAYRGLIVAPAMDELSIVIAVIIGSGA